jgi:hypothetical protein
VEKIRMARLPFSGVSFASLYEFETTLDQVISKLGLPSLSSEDEGEVRTLLQMCIGKWLQIHPDCQAKGFYLRIEHVQSRLKRIAEHLEEIDGPLSAAGEGLHRSDDFEVASQLALALKHRVDIGSIDTAREHLSRFRDCAQDLAHAARIAAALLEDVPRKSGRLPHDWYVPFVMAVDYICMVNLLPKSFQNDRISDFPKGRYFEIASEFEMLLYPHMRSSSPAARARRISRSHTTLRAITRSDKTPSWQDIVLSM